MASEGIAAVTKRAKNGVRGNKMGVSGNTAVTPLSVDISIDSILIKVSVTAVTAKKSLYT
jgi:hypothetical protein